MDAAKQEAAKAANELDEPIWSVVSFERVEGANLSYEAASELLMDLELKKVPGLCIVTDEAAARVKTPE